jgi:hypothetical protein
VKTRDTKGGKVYIQTYYSRNNKKQTKQSQELYELKQYLVQQTITEEQIEA